MNSNFVFSNPPLTHVCLCVCVCVRQCISCFSFYWTNRSTKHTLLCVPQQCGRMLTKMVPIILLLLVFPLATWLWSYSHQERGNISLPLWPLECDGSFGVSVLTPSLEKPCLLLLSCEIYQARARLLKVHAEANCPSHGSSNPAYTGWPTNTWASPPKISRAAYPTSCLTVGSTRSQTNRNKCALLWATEFGVLLYSNS